MDIPTRHRVSSLGAFLFTPLSAISSSAASDVVLHLLFVLGCPLFLASFVQSLFFFSFYVLFFFIGLFSQKLLRPKIRPSITVYAAISGTLVQASRFWVLNQVSSLREIGFLSLFDLSFGTVFSILLFPAKGRSVFSLLIAAMLLAASSLSMVLYSPFADSSSSYFVVLLFIGYRALANLRNMVLHRLCLKQISSLSASGDLTDPLRDGMKLTFRRTLQSIVLAADPCPGGVLELVEVKFFGEALPCFLAGCFCSGFFYEFSQVLEWNAVTVVVALTLSTQPLICCASHTQVAVSLAESQLVFLKSVVVLAILAFAELFGNPISRNVYDAYVLIFLVMCIVWITRLSDSDEQRMAVRRMIDDVRLSNWDISTRDRDYLMRASRSFGLEYFAVLFSRAVLRESKMVPGIMAAFEVRGPPSAARPTRVSTNTDGEFVIVRKRAVSPGRQTRSSSADSDESGGSADV